MRWRTPVEAKVGTHRTRCKFAWLPTPVEDGYTVWLGTYYVIEELRWQFSNMMGTMTQVWVEVRRHA